MQIFCISIHFSMHFNLLWVSTCQLVILWLETPCLDTPYVLSCSEDCNTCCGSCKQGCKISHVSITYRKSIFIGWLVQQQIFTANKNACKIHLNAQKQGVKNASKNALQQKHDISWDLWQIFTMPCKYTPLCHTFHWDCCLNCRRHNQYRKHTMWSLLSGRKVLWDT